MQLSAGLGPALCCPLRVLSYTAQPCVCIVLQGCTLMHLHVRSGAMEMMLLAFILFTKSQTKIATMQLDSRSATSKVPFPEPTQMILPV